MTAYSTLVQGADPSALQPILLLSNTIFGVGPSQPATHHSSLAEWSNRLNDPESIIACATQASDGDASKPVGFIFAYPKKFQSLNDSPGLHIWLSGVSEDCRGGGVFGFLMCMVERFASERRFQRMTVATFPSKFGRMYAVLLKTGWKLVDDVDMGEEGKVLLTKEVRPVTSLS